MHIVVNATPVLSALSSSLWIPALLRRASSSPSPKLCSLIHGEVQTKQETSTYPVLRSGQVLPL